MVQRVTQKNLFFGFSTVGRLPQETKLHDFELLKQNLLNRLYTRKGERVMFPEIGSIIWDMLFEPLTPAVRDMIVQDVKMNVTADGRLDFQNIQVFEQDHGLRVEVELLYRPYNIVGQFAADFDRRSVER